MKSKDVAKNTLSETRFAHFVRSAPDSERKRVFVRAIKEATEDQRKVVAAHKSMRSDQCCPA
ncbi:hypothetical protein [Comamonas jiangduensis]|uniref:hypothetical protein n=1 Tax=Comamonas jiangduensis TaxID=1194168 RepID=UPI003BF82913